MENGSVMAKPNPAWRKRADPSPWTPDEDAKIVEMTALGVGFHEHTIAAILPGRTAGQAIERRYQLRAGGIPAQAPKGKAT